MMGVIGKEGPPGPVGPVVSYFVHWTTSISLAASTTAMKFFQGEVGPAGFKGLNGTPGQPGEKGPRGQSGNDANYCPCPDKAGSVGVKRPVGTPQTASRPQPNSPGPQQQQRPPNSYDGGFSQQSFFTEKK